MEIKQALLTKNIYSRPGTKLSRVKKVVIHWVGNANSTAQANRNYFESLKTKKIYASAHYIIGLEGEILQCIPENEIAYHATVANGYSIGIENCHPRWDGKFNEKTYNSLIELCVDICKRNGIKQLNYTGDANGNLTRHNMFAATACPGPYLQSKFSYIAEEVNKQLLAPEARNIKAGSAVKILPGATYVSGKSIPEYIREKTWYVKYVGNGNACLGRSTDNKYNLFTEVPIKYLEAVSDPNKIVAGVGVRILPGAKYPSGKEIPVEIRKKWWYVKYVANGKACLDWSVDGILRLFTEIPIKYL